jgi:hypothetical protein
MLTVLMLNKENELEFSVSATPCAGGFDYGIGKIYLLYTFPPELHTLMTSLF